MISEKLYEISLVFVIVAIILAFAVAEIRDFGKEVALKSDLRNFRAAIKMYYSRHNKYPPSLEVAADKGYGANVSLIIYHDRDNRICDPFGRRYSYNPVNGELRSKTSGYESY